MRHTDKTVTVFRKIWDEENACDVYHGAVLDGVSFFGKVAAGVSMDGLTASSEATLRIPAEVIPIGFSVTTGDLVCCGRLATEGLRPSDLTDLCDYVYTVVSVTPNLSGHGAHIKVVCE